MTAPSTNMFGIPRAAHHDLMRLLELCPSYLGEGKRDNRRRKRADNLSDRQIQTILDAKKKFEDTHMPLELAVRKVLKEGWSGDSPQKTLERYRKSQAKQKHAANWYPDLKGHEKYRTTWLHDNDMRSGSPTGPVFCTSADQAIRVLGSMFAQLGAKIGIDALDDPKRYSLPDPEAIGITISPVEIGKKLMLGIGLPGRMPTELLHHLIAVTRSKIVTKSDLADLRGIDIYVPLDCPKKERDETIDKIVTTWNQMCKQRGKTIDIRDRQAGNRKSLETLPARIRSLTKPSSGSKKQQKPHSTSASDRGGDSSGAFAKHLHDALRTEGYAIDIKVLDDCIHDALDAMSRFQDNEQPEM